MTDVHVDLPAGPRELTADERRLVTELAQAAGLGDQVPGCRVTGACACGCASIRLTTEGPLEPPSHRAVGATGVRAEGGQVDVVLHVLAGRLAELEVFDPEHGEGHRVDPADVLELTGLH